MRLRSVTLSNIRRFDGTVTIDTIAPGLNVLSAPNEEGKSTLFDALQAVFFQKHRGKPKEIQALRPHAGGAPMVSVELETPEGVFTITKRWLSRPMAELRDAAERIVAKDDAAEDWLAALTEPPETGGPAGLLWVRQGLTALDEGARKEADAATRARRDLLSSVAGEVEALTGGRRMERALAACEAELAELITAKGKSKAGGPLKDAEDAVEALSARRETLESLAADMHKALDERRALRAELSDLQDPEAEAARRDRLARSKAAAETARAHAERVARADEALRHAKLGVEAAEARLTALRQARATCEDAARALHLRRAAEQEARQASENAAQLLASSKDALEAAAKEFQEAQSTQRAAEAAERAAASAQRRAELSKRLERAREFAGTARTAAEAAHLGPDQATMERLDAAAQELRVQETLHARAAPRLRMSYLPDAAPITMNGAPMPDGTDLPLDGPAMLDLPGLGRLQLTPGTATQDDAALRDARKALERALSGCDQPTLEAARKAARDRQAALAAQKEALAALQAAAPEGLAALETALAALPDLPPEDAPEPRDPTETAARLDAAQRAEAGAAAAHEAARARAHVAEREEARAIGLCEAAAARLAEAEAQMPDAPEAADARLQAALTKAEATLHETSEEVRRQSADAPDLDAIEAALRRAQDVVESAEQRIRALSERRARLDAEIDLRAGEGIEEDLAATCEALDEAEARQERLSFERDMLLTLRSALDKARSEAREHFFAPVTQELAPLLKLLWPGAELVFDEDTVLPVRLLREGREEDIDVLSGGTREQIALLVRLAFARLLARSGRHAPVILDDALVYTDDTRIERMFDALHRQAGDLQILVLTCRQRAFRDLGGRMLGFAPADAPDAQD